MCLCTVCVYVCINDSFTPLIMLCGASRGQWICGGIGLRDWMICYGTLTIER